MFSKAGIGKSKRKNPTLAAKEAYEKSLKNLGKDPDFLIIFATANYDQKELLEGIEALNEKRCPVIGCSGEGIITSDASDEENHVIGIFAYASDQIKFTPFFIEGVAEDSETAGTALAKKITEMNVDNPKAIILFPDGLRSNVSNMLRALDKGLPSPIPILGGTSGDSLQFVKSYQYFNGMVLEGAVTGFVLSGNIEIDFIVSHGCSPIGKPVKVTKAQGNVLYEFDNKPAADVLNAYFDIDSSKENIIHGGVGVRLPPEQMSPDYDHSYIMRAPMGLNPDRSLILAADVENNSEVLYHRREPKEVAARAKKSFQTMLSRHQHQDPYFVMQFDCAGRGKSLFNNEVTANIVTPLTSCLEKPEIPWFGFHSFGEIAPLNHHSIYHNYTVVLCVVYPKAKSEAA